MIPTNTPRKSAIASPRLKWQFPRKRIPFIPSSRRRAFAPKSFEIKLSKIGNSRSSMKIRCRSNSVPGTLEVCSQCFFRFFTLRKQKIVFSISSFLTEVSLTPCLLIVKQRVLTSKSIVSRRFDQQTRFSTVFTSRTFNLSLQFSLTIEDDRSSTRVVRCFFS